MITHFEDIKDDKRIFILKQDTFVKVAAAAFERLKSSIQDMSNRSRMSNNNGILSIRRAVSTPYQNSVHTVDWNMHSFGDRRKVNLYVYIIRFLFVCLFVCLNRW